MHVLLNGSSLKLVRLSMKPADFSHYLTQGIGSDGRLAKTEALARDLIARSFPSDLSLQFVKAVCLWGGDPRRAGKVIKNNRPSDISRALRRAYQFSAQNKLKEAIEAVTEPAGLAVSFGSKHLKFLAPNKHVVLDSIISERLGYRRDVTGYLEWLDTCRQFLRTVRRYGVSYPGIGKNGWRVSDIEMAIFNKIRSE